MIRRVEDARREAAARQPRRVAPRHQRADRLPGDVDARATSSIAAPGGRRATSDSGCRPRARPARRTNIATRGLWGTRLTSLPASGSGSIVPAPSCPAATPASWRFPSGARSCATRRPARRGRPFTRPQGLVAVEICQDSGLLPVGACHRARRVTRDGETREASTVAYEYFRRGTEPTETCPIHDYSWFGNVRTAMFDPTDFPSSTVVGALLKPAPRQSVTSDEPRPATESARAAEPEKQVDSPRERQRRGFWSRVFGRGEQESP